MNEFHVCLPASNLYFPSASPSLHRSTQAPALGELYTYFERWEGSGGFLTADFTACFLFWKIVGPWGEVDSGEAWAPPLSTGEGFIEALCRGGWPPSVFLPLKFMKVPLFLPWRNYT